MRHILTVLVSLYTCVVLVLFFCVADQALGHAGRLPASPTLLCLVLLAPFGVVLLTKHCVAPRHPGPLRALAENSAALTPFALVALCALLLSLLPGTYWYEGAKWILLIPYGLCITCSATFLGYFRGVVVVLPLSLLLSNTILAVSVWYDTMHPGTFAPITNRAAGFPGNANFAALVSVMLCAGGLRFGSSVTAGRATTGRVMALCGYTPPAADRHSLLLNLFLLTTTFAVICMTMSRSGLVNFSALIAIFVIYRFCYTHLSARQRAVEVIAYILFTAAALAATVAFTQLSAVSHGNSRLSRFLNNQRVDDGSAGTRLQALSDGITLIEASPFVGHGTGFSRRMSELPHNIYVQQWVNNGLLGVVSYGAFLVCALRTFLRRSARNGVALIIVAIIGGIFSHNILDQRPFLILLGVLLGRSAADRPAGGIALLQAPLHNVPTPPPLPASVWGDRAIAQ